ncbi:hypothetical protein SDC9_104377 [bioreactor metagenome]|uniref:Uncharacterized protein n=1 Tax=bioreactor metagenome TaxID=1076179 RepID=A0A645AWD3_9ZZZZ
MFLLEILAHDQRGLARQRWVLVARGIHHLGEPLVAHLEPFVAAERSLHAVGYQRGLCAAVVEVDGLQVALGQARRGQRVDGHQMPVGAAKDRHLAALQVLEALDVGLRGHRHVKVVAHAAGQQQLGLEAVGAPDDGGQIALVGEVDLLIRQRLVHGRACALEEQPFHADARILEGVFQPLVGAQHAAGRAAPGDGITAARGGHADADGFGRRGMCGGRPGQGQRQGERCECGASARCERVRHVNSLEQNDALAPRKTRGATGVDGR